MVASGVPNLSTLRFRTRFSNYEPYVRAATVVAGVVVPATCFGLVAWLAPGRDIFGSTGLLFLIIVGVIVPTVFLTSLAVPHTVVLGPTEIEVREFRRRRKVATPTAIWIGSIAHPRRVIFAVLGRDGDDVLFGPGLARTEIESVRGWLQTLASSLGVVFRENVSLQEAMAVLPQMRVK
jgi:hypothetical protein